MAGTIIVVIDVDDAKEMASWGYDPTASVQGRIAEACQRALAANEEDED